jgi:hypothetical protein
MGGRQSRSGRFSRRKKSLVFIDIRTLDRLTCSYSLFRRLLQLLGNFSHFYFVYFTDRKRQ